VAQASR